MDVEHATTPIFTDASGRRATVLLWAARGVCVSLLLLTGAVAFTLLTQVSLPGLGELVGPQSAARPPSTANDSASDGTGAFDAARRSLPEDPSVVGESAARAQPRATVVTVDTTAARPNTTSSALTSSQPKSAVTGPKGATTHEGVPPPAATPQPSSPPTSAPAPAPVKGGNSQGSTTGAARSSNANPAPGTPRRADNAPTEPGGSGRAVGRPADPGPTSPSATP